MVSDWLNNNPEILALLIAASGFILAPLLARLTQRWFLRLEAVARRRSGDGVERINLVALRRMLRAVVYFGTLLAFLLLALQVLSTSLVRDWLATLLEYLPQLVLAGLIILFGYLLGVLARGMIAGLMGVDANHLAPRFAQLLVVTVAALTGLAQTAIDISFISDVLIILLAFFFGGLSLAFAIGSRPLVENLLARRALDRYRIGDHVRIDGTEGTIIEILSTAVVLEVKHGLLTLPTSRFMVADVLLIKGDAGDNGASGNE